MHASFLPCTHACMYAFVYTLIALPLSMQMSLTCTLSYMRAGTFVAYGTSAASATPKGGPGLAWPLNGAS